MQPYHAAGLTRQLRRFFISGLTAIRRGYSRAKDVGWAFPRSSCFDASTWALLPTRERMNLIARANLNPDCSGGIDRIAFPLAEEATAAASNNLARAALHFAGEIAAGASSFWKSGWRHCTWETLGTDLVRGRRASRTRVDKTRSRFVVIGGSYRRAGNGRIC